MNKTKLFIVGCGNVGGFVAYNFDTFNSENFEIEGFLDDDTEKHGKVIFDYPVLGGFDLIKSWDKEIAVVIGIADPITKKEVKKRITSPNVCFPSLLSKNAWVSKNVKIGQGAVIYPGVTIDYHVEIGEFVLVNKNCSLGHNSILSRFSTLAPGVCLAGFTHLEECVNVGINSATKQSVHIGKNTIIGGMAMVVKDLPENITAVGIPAKVVKHNTPY